MSSPRILAIMGSGEAAPTMAKVHRALLDRLGESARVTIVDTPYGFQENADELSTRMADFFATTVGRPATIASYRSAEVDAVGLATAVARIREAGYAMAGPGSPSYALRVWAGSAIPEAFADKLADGGIVTMASAAALTLGVVTIPVYEIYKVGETPRWLEGLDLLGRATGLRAAVVPHYDNAEGGTHDTRFCYLGERRLRMLERQLPDGAFVLGVDGHTALVLDLEAGTAAVFGLGGATVRAGGRSAVIGSGSEIRIARLGELAAELASGGIPMVGGDADALVATEEAAGSRRDRAASPGPLRDAVAQLEGSFIHDLGDDDTRGAIAALLDLDEAIAARIRAGEDSPDLDNARATFRSLIARLGEHAAAGPRDMGGVVGPFVDALVELRARARADRDWAEADLIRDRLLAAGVEIRDGANDSTWVLQDRDGS